MAKVGHQLFAESALWLAKACQRQFASAIIDILQAEPNLSDVQVANALMECFEPNLLVIDEPIRTSLSWDTISYRLRTGEVQPCSLHEAEVPYTGTPHLWRLAGATNHHYHTRVTADLKIARLRVMRPDHDIEQFRRLIREDLGAARFEVSQQNPAIEHFRYYLREMVEQLFKHHGIDALRDEARTCSRLTFRTINK